MRVIAGKLGGRSFNAPKGHRTHPMSEKARGALFATLGDIEGLSVLDAFAGSGALSFEAISRGASRVVAVEVDKNAHKIIMENARLLGVRDQTKIIRANVSSWSDNNSTELFDLILCDPPHDTVKPNLLNKLSVHLKPSGIFCLSLPRGTAISLDGLRLVKQNGYGDMNLNFYKRD